LGHPGTEPDFVEGEFEDVGDLRAGVTGDEEVYDGFGSGRKLSDRLLERQLGGEVGGGVSGANRENFN
jgi:hypothetical protein